MIVMVDVVTGCVVIGVRAVAIMAVVDDMAVVIVIVVVVLS